MKMARSLRLSLLLALACLVVVLMAPSTVSASRRSHPDEVFHLPGQSFTPSFRHYSGYIPLPDSPTRLHYWFVESQGNPEEDPVGQWRT